MNKIVYILNIYFYDKEKLNNFNIIIVLCFYIFLLCFYWLENFNLVLYMKVELLIKKDF